MENHPTDSLKEYLFFHSKPYAVMAAFFYLFAIVGFCSLRITVFL
jgi:hypothetical protein